MRTLTTILFILIAFAFNAQTINKGEKFLMGSLIGLDSTRKDFSFEKMEMLGRSGYLLNLEEDGSFSAFGYAFCGVGEKAYVYGTYELLPKNEIRFHFDRIVYKDMGQETRKVQLHSVVTYHYDLEKKELIELKRK